MALSDQLTKLATRAKEAEDHAAAAQSKAKATPKAQHNADNAEGDALFAIDYAYAAIEEAEYAVLDASLARMKADELAASA
jgi:hypothetical protein